MWHTSRLRHKSRASSSGVHFVHQEKGMLPTANLAIEHRGRRLTLGRDIELPELLDFLTDQFVTAYDCWKCLAAPSCRLARFVGDEEPIPPCAYQRSVLEKVITHSLQTLPPPTQAELSAIIATALSAAESLFHSFVASASFAIEDDHLLAGLFPDTVVHMSQIVRREALSVLDVAAGLPKPFSKPTRLYVEGESDRILLQAVLNEVLGNDIAIRALAGSSNKELYLRAIFTEDREQHRIPIVVFDRPEDGTDGALPDLEQKGLLAKGCWWILRNDIEDLFQWDYIVERSAMADMDCADASVLGSVGLRMNDSGLTFGRAMRLVLKKDVKNRAEWAPRAMSAKVALARAIREDILEAGETIRTEFNAAGQAFPPLRDLICLARWIWLASGKHVRDEAYVCEKLREAQDGDGTMWQRLVNDDRSP